jgi:hypothetical protein
MKKKRRKMVAKLFLLVALRRHSKGQNEADKKWGLSLDYISVKKKRTLSRGHGQQNSPPTALRV